jgi:hypothetical protein
MSREGAPLFGYETPPLNYLPVDQVYPDHAEVGAS